MEYAEQYGMLKGDNKSGWYTNTESVRKITLRELIEVIPKDHILCISDNNSVVPHLPMTGDKVRSRCAKIMDFTVAQVVAMDEHKIFIELEG